MGTCAKCLHISKHREQQKNCYRRVRFRCGFTSYNACWPSSHAPTRQHVRLEAAPLEPGLYCVKPPHLTVYMIPMKGFDLALLDHSCGGYPGGQSDWPPTPPIFNPVSVLLL